MTLVDTETGSPVLEADVRASIQRVINHAESIWDEWAWQVENKTWAVLGYADWDEMRRHEYGSLTSVSAPRAERPELVARFRSAGLTQQQTANTLGVTVKTVKRDEHPEWKGTNVPSPEDVVDAEVVEDEQPYALGDDETVNVETGEIIPIRPAEAAPPRQETHSPAPSLKPVVNEDEWSEQDRAEELASNLARNVSLLYAVTNPERRAEFIATWRLGTRSRPVLGQNFVTPSHMRALAEALHTFASEWENADV